MVDAGCKPLVGFLFAFGEADRLSSAMIWIRRVHIDSLAHEFSRAKRQDALTFVQRFCAAKKCSRYCSGYPCRGAWVGCCEPMPRSFYPVEPLPLKLHTIAPGIPSKQRVGSSNLPGRASSLWGLLSTSSVDTLQFVSNSNSTFDANGTTQALSCLGGVTSHNAVSGQRRAFVRLREKWLIVPAWRLSSRRSSQRHCDSPSCSPINLQET